MALPLLVFVATGLPLQFTAELRLGSQGVSLAWVQDRYGVEAPAQVTVLPDVQQAEVLQADATLMTATRQMTVSGRLLGAYSMPQWTIFATSEELLIIPNIEQVPVERLALPQTITAFGRTDDPYLLIESSAGIEFSADLGLTWRQYTGAAGVWQIPSFRAPTRQEAQRYAATQLSWERFAPRFAQRSVFWPDWGLVYVVCGIGLGSAQFHRLVSVVRVKAVWAID